MTLCKFSGKDSLSCCSFDGISREFRGCRQINYNCIQENFLTIAKSLTELGLGLVHILDQQFNHLIE